MATLELSGSPSFGGAGTGMSGNIVNRDGNYKTGELIGQTNGTQG